MEFLTSIVDFFLHIDQHLDTLSSQYGSWIYAILFLVIFCETGLVVTPFLPGDSLLFAAGSIAALGTSMDIHIMVLLLTTAAILGDTVNYAIGRFVGLKLFKPNSRFFKQSHLDKTHAFYEKYGGKAIIFARFMPIIRTFAPFVAGVGKMTYGKFFLYNVIGAILWVFSFSYAGYFFGNLPFVKSNLTLIILAIIVVSILPAVFELIKYRRQKG
ncbi:DedA family protein [Neisseria sp. Ec49-e6-T10]|uniref:DedA family protein n=1 Tax=Neisseria sp. Ec49-e6-T10 TaxID=3140744 RepID=UPI003EB94FFF